MAEAVSHAALGKGPDCIRAFAGPEAERLQALWADLHATMELWPDRPVEANQQVIAKVLPDVQQDVPKTVG